MLRFETLEKRAYLHGEGFFPAGHEMVPNYVHEPDTVSVQDGDWFDEATWSNGVPDDDDDVRIDHRVIIGVAPLSGDLDQDGAVGYDDAMAWLVEYRSTTKTNPLADIDANGSLDRVDLQLLLHEWFYPSRTSEAAVAEDILVNGQLSFRPDLEVRLEVQTLTVLGSLELGTDEAPVTASAEIIFRDAPIDTMFDPEQFGHGLLVLGSGSLTTNGRDRTPFMEIASAEAGSQTITLAADVEGWVAGDEVFLPDTRMMESHDFAQTETVKIVAVNGRQITLSQPLLYSHDGANGNLPHAAYLGGNIVFRSENPNGVRGHVLVNDRADVNVRDATFADLGRTTIEQLDNTHLGSHHNALHVGKNQTGRYAFHIHHLYGPLDAGDYQFEFSNNVVRQSAKWGVAIHGSHYGLVSENVVVDAQGSGIVFEDGSEFGNELTRNFVALVKGSGLGVQGRSNGEEPQLVGDGTPNNPFRTEGDLGHEGAGIWGRGISNDMTGNVVANVNMGMVFWSRFQPTERIPAFRGADTHVDSATLNVNPGQQLGHQFERNEFYGVTVAANWQGLSHFVATDLVTWNVGSALDASYNGRLEIQGGSFHGRDGFATKMGYTGYIGLNGVRVVGFRQGVLIADFGAVANSYFDCTYRDIIVQYEKTSPGQRQIVIDGVRFGDDRANITYELGDIFNKRSYTAPLDVLVRNYNQVPGDDFQLWLPQQSANYAMPVEERSRLSPERGLTNGQLWDKYRLALAGKLLPPTATQRPGIIGLVTRIQSDLAGPVISDVIVSVHGTTATIIWKTDELASSQLEWNMGDIKVERYANLMRADSKLTTKHHATITGLKSGKEYSFLIRVFDEAGNLGGYTELGGLKYVALKFRA